MSFIEKPTDGYYTPYQTLVDGFVNYMKTKLSANASDYEEQLTRWNSLNESNCDITTPIWDDKKQQWNITIQSPTLGIKNTIPLVFKTITVHHFLDTALINVKRQNLLGKSIKEPGFYFTKDSQQVILVVFSDFDFSTSILNQGWEFKPDSYKLSDDKQTLIVDNPVVKGDIPIIYIEREDEKE